LGSCGHANSPPIGGVGLNFGEAGALQAGDDAAHGGSFDLLGGGQLAQRHGASEDEEGKRGEAGRADSGENVLLAGVAKKMDGGGVQAVGYFETGGRLRRPGIMTRHT
jgi:hypothetical protein